ncbi:MAG: TIGR03790 family protein [Verrucomicrobiaceae bacterium]|nr:TIGR03790 family protein [Verrucomicrobiaceae bacterium]
MTNEDLSTPDVNRGPRHAGIGLRGHALVRQLLALLTLSMGLLQAQTAAPWDAAAETVVLYNPKFAGSEELARYYAEKRLIPTSRIIGLECQTNESMSRGEYDRQIRTPLRQAFVTRKWWVTDPKIKAAGASNVREARVRIIAVMRGVPFRIGREKQNPQAAMEDEASVDAELAVLAMNAPDTAGGLKNPYFGQPERAGYFQKAPGLLLIGRLDGPDDKTVRRMIDDAVATEQSGLQGRAVIDLAQKNTGGYKEGEDWLKNTALVYQRYGIPTWTDRVEPLLQDHWPLPDTALYFGWYTSDIQGAIASPEFQFRRGAVVCHLHSFSAAQLRDGTRSWCGPLLTRGAAATFGNVFEPYLGLTVHFDILNLRLLEGFTLAEAGWNATPALSWMNVILGDPLYRPFAKNSGLGLGSEEDRDYLLYRGAARRSPIDPDAAIKTTITALAEKRKSSRLLELTALLSASQEKYAEAAELLDHAAALTKAPADRLRLNLYRAECLRRDDKPKTAIEVLKHLLDDKSIKDEPARRAAQSLLNGIGG